MKEYKYNPTRFIRFINKFTKDFVDIPFVGGTFTTDRRRMAKLAHYYAGWNIFSNKKEKPKFHFYVLWNKGDGDVTIGGIYFGKPLRDGSNILTYGVNLDTNEIITDDVFNNGLKKIGIIYDDFFKLLEIKNMA